jgi:hypothetical protein
LRSHIFDGDINGNGSIFTLSVISITIIERARILVIAVNARAEIAGILIGATGNRIAHINGAGVAIIAAQSREGAQAGNADVVGAGVPVIAGNGNEDTCTEFAFVGGAEVPVIANDGSEHAA